ncbi:hypothetical protein BJ973_004027 [Actinoplanes tereljensis]|uniref:Uncharacterized protein n=1 Tax=Paractinoplanes tereljensis TaxID=571912 RepID=A0A919NWQ7_9ACTN|nr:hypothetical protein [Actinoplanes tereljensis]GIF25753.1 hypothetical protein Ate02nite_84830 [Actinoplanes tereljensis]
MNKQNDDSIGLQPNSDDDLVTIHYHSEHDLVRGIAQWALCTGWITVREYTIWNSGRKYGRVDLLLRATRDACPVLIEVKRGIHTLDEAKSAFKQLADYRRAYAAENGATPVCLLVYGECNNEVVDIVSRIYAQDVLPMSGQDLLTFLAAVNVDQRLGRARRHRSSLARQTESASRAIRMMQRILQQRDSAQ